MSGGIEAKIEGLLEEKFKEEDFSNCYLIEIIHHQNNKLEVFIDSDSGINFKTCKQISRYLEQFIDEEKWLGEKYVLEVSSPGVDRPLQLKRQYVKNIGRQLEVTNDEGEVQQGKLIEVDDEKVVIEYVEVIKEGKKKKKQTIQKEFAFDSISKAVVKVSF